MTIVIRVCLVFTKSIHIVSSGESSINTIAIGFHFGISQVVFSTELEKDDDENWSK